jgi:hypothetical protein
MTTALPVSRLINFGVVLTPALTQGPALNTGLVLGTSTIIDTVSRKRDYNSLSAVATDFGTTAEEYLAAVVWFGQQPQPTALSVGRWCKTAAAGRLICGGLSAANSALSAWTVINNGNFKIQVDGGLLTNTIGSIDFTSGVLSLAGVANKIQLAIQGLAGAFAAVTCTYNAVFNRFEITSGTTGPSSSVSFLQAGANLGGTDISGMMAGNSSSNGAYTAPGAAAETALAAVQLFDNQFGGQWYNLLIPSSVVADQVAIAPYIDGGNNPHFQWITTNDQSHLIPGNTSNLGYQLQQLMSQHTAWQYSSTSSYAAWSMAARIATVNWAGSQTAISLMYKNEPGVIPEGLNSTQANAIDGYDGNVYTSYLFGAATAILEQGICPSGQFIDTIIGVDGLRLQITTNLFNLLIGTATKIPQTDAGVGILENGVDAACAQYVVNGLLAPGVWNGQSFGQLQNGQWLDKGYYIYAPSIATQSPSQRAARVAPPIQTAAKLAGAIDTAFGTIYVNQ